MVYMRPADALNSETFIGEYSQSVQMARFKREIIAELGIVNILHRIPEGTGQTHPNIVMILDNARYHKSLAVSRFIE